MSAALVPAPELLLAVVGALLALSGRRGREEAALWIALLTTGAAALMVAGALLVPPAGAGPGLVRDGCAASFQLLTLGATVGALVLGANDVSRRPVPGWLLLGASGGCLLAGAATPAAAVVALLYAGLALLGGLRAARASRGPVDVVWLVSALGCVALGTSLMGVVGDGARLDRLALPAGRAPGEGLTELACAALGAGGLLGALFLGRVGGRPETSPAAMAWLGAWVAGLAGLGTRLLLGLPYLARGLELGGVDWQTWLALLGAGLAAGAHTAAALQRGLKPMVGWLLTGQVGLLSLGLATVHADPAGDAALLAGGGPALVVHLLAVLLAHVGLCGLVLTADNELGGDALSRLHGLWGRNPWLTSFGGLLLASPLGLPGTLGFVGLLGLLRACLAAGHLGPVALALAGQVALAYGAVRLLAATLARPEGGGAEEPLVTTPGLTTALAALTAGAVGLGVGPAGLVGFSLRLQLLG